MSRSAKGFCHGLQAAVRTSWICMPFTRWRKVTRRRHPADTRLDVSGAVAEAWMLRAQAFAGPPGEGRRPGQFPKPG